jgi:hypothetical protein
MRSVEVNASAIGKLAIAVVRMFVMTTRQTAYARLLKAIDWLDGYDY